MNSRFALLCAFACAPLAAQPAPLQPAAPATPAASAPVTAPAAAATAPPVTSAPAAAVTPPAAAAPPAEPAVVAAPFDVKRPEIAQWIREVASHHEGWSRRSLVRLLAHAEPQPKVIEAMNRPLEKVAPWYEYRERLLTQERIDRGVQFWNDHKPALERISAQYHVPPEYLVAIIGVETFYGRSTGRYRVIDVLATLGFDYPQRGSYFRGELEQFLILSRENKLDPLTTTGSYAGALGVPQFMPSVYRRYAVDADTDKRRDLWGDWDDILASVANYLDEHGWTAGAPVLAETTLDPSAAFDIEPRLELNQTVGALAAHGLKVNLDVPAETPVVLISAEQREGPAYRVGFHNFYVITRYNVSARYAMTVHDLATAIAMRVHGPQP